MFYFNKPLYQAKFWLSPLMVNHLIVEPSLPVRNISSLPHSLFDIGFMQFLVHTRHFPLLLGFFQISYSLVSTLAQKQTHKSTFLFALFWPSFYYRPQSKDFFVLGAGDPVKWINANQVFLSHTNPGNHQRTLSSHNLICRHRGSDVIGQECRVTLLGS